jgi:hypothetical protein
LKRKLVSFRQIEDIKSDIEKSNKINGVSISFFRLFKEARKMKKAIKQLKDTLRFMEDYLTGDTDDPMEIIYKRLNRVLAELEKEARDEKGD